MGFNAEKAQVLDTIDAAERAARIERRVNDQSGAFRLWVSTVNVAEELP